MILGEGIWGAADGGAEVDVLGVGKLERRHVCGDGWGSCREKRRCVFSADGFTEAQARMIKQSD
ncbi:MAG: hypothetical protein LBH70_08795 [Spirochaetaceae bacterium]|nr:hypothetical protein [Spirochaetaceae bacterium]